MIAIFIFSRKMLEWLAEGIQVSFVRQISTKLSRLYFIQKQWGVNNSFYYYQSQSPARELFEGEEGDRLSQSLIKFNTIYLSGITMAILYKAGRTLNLSSVFRKRVRAVINQILKVTTIWLPSFSDEETLKHRKCLTPVERDILLMVFIWRGARLEGQRLPRGGFS